MNFLWRKGNRNYPNDELPIDEARPEVIRYIRDAFISLGEKNKTPIVLDKTCHNCLRLDFVHKVLPEASYIYIVRNGYDVVPSTMLRWQQSIPKGEFKKLFSIPRSDIAHYVFKTLRNQMNLLNPNEQRVKVWGPEIEGLGSYVESHSLAETCAFQWTRFMEMTDAFFDSSDAPEQVLRLVYHEVVDNPTSALRQISEFTKEEISNDLCMEWEEKMKFRPPGAGATKLLDELDSVETIMKRSLDRHGFTADLE